MIRILCLLLAFAQIVFAQEVILSEENRYWKFHNWAAVGYRYDRQHFNEFNGNTHSLNSRLSIHGRSSPFLTIGNHTEYKNVLLILRGSYGWLGSGQVGYDLPGNYGSTPLAFQKFDDDAGYSAEGKGSLSYIFTPTAEGSNFTFSFIPGIGYAYFHLADYPSGTNTYSIPSGAANLSAGTTGFANSTFNHSMQQDWFGPFFEGRLLFRFFQNSQIEFFYQYHLPDDREQRNEYLPFQPFYEPGSGAIGELSHCGPRERSTITARRFRCPLSRPQVIDVRHPF